MTTRLKIIIRGAVQGVGFRPFIYKLASELKLTGYVLNNSQGVFIEAEGKESVLREFLTRIERDKPKLSVITSLEHSFLDPSGNLTSNWNSARPAEGFVIRESTEDEEISALILPDIAVCDECLNEMFNPNDRRYLYPFINCTNCGPRFSIIESLPYDRPNTSMKIFKLCDRCREEYENPSDRRFHAQPIACPACGPQLFLWDESGKTIFEKHEALIQTAELIKKGKIIALKGMGGFQLIADATNDEAINELRRRKHREEKPFALMFPSLHSIKKVCEVSKIEERVLTSPESPIVLLKKKSGLRHRPYGIRDPEPSITELIAHNNPYFGAMLPYTPLHLLLLSALKIPIVATSANLSEEPICIDQIEALERLSGIADYFLVHNRPIVRHVDDSIVRVLMNREMLIRRARGYAPLPILFEPKAHRHSGGNEKFTEQSGRTILAVGGHLKNTVALKKGNNIFISQHIGDLSTEESNKTFKKVIHDFQILYNAKPDIILSDLHPEYLSTKHAKNLSNRVEQIQHHQAHVAACRLENQIAGEAIGVCWDGTGYGPDGSIWGGEFFLTDDFYYWHTGQFRKFKLPGGEKAVKEPRRSLAGVLFEIAGSSFIMEFADLLKGKFSKAELSDEGGLILNMLAKNINSPATSSVGRLFDAVSSLLGICDRTNYEGQAAMMLEFAADMDEYGVYAFDLADTDIFQPEAFTKGASASSQGKALVQIIDWRPVLISIIRDLRFDVKPSIIAAKFHNTLAEIVLAIANCHQKEKVILSGGCFQNALLIERTIRLLQKNNYKVYWHQRVPPNDGGISLGQIAAYLQLKTDEPMTRIKPNKKFLKTTEQKHQLEREMK